MKPSDTRPLPPDPTHDPKPPVDPPPPPVVSEDPLPPKPSEGGKPTDDKKNGKNGNAAAKVSADEAAVEDAPAPVVEAPLAPGFVRVELLDKNREFREAIDIAEPAGRTVGYKDGHYERVGRNAFNGRDQYVPY